MKNSDTRDMMARLYRLIEKYELAPTIKYTDEAKMYFDSVHEDCKALYDDYLGNCFASEFAIAFCTAIEKNFSSANAMPLVERRQMIVDILKNT